MQCENKAVYLHQKSNDVLPHGTEFKIGTFGVDSRSAVSFLPHFRKRSSMEGKNEIQVVKKTTLLGKELTVFGTAENPLFIAKEVADWIEHSDVSRMVKVVDDDEKLTRTMFVSGQGREVWLLTEDGVYEVLMQSRKPIAKEFKKGVKKILHEIRMTGGYIAASNDMTDDEIMARALVVAQTTIQRRDERIRQLEQKAAEQADALHQQDLQIASMSEEIVEMKKKTDYLEIILSSVGSVTTTQIAQDYGMSAVAFNKQLEKMRIQRKVNGQWILYAPYISEGYIKSKTIDITRSDGRPDTVMHTEWRQKGRLFLYNKLKEIGILPLIERQTAALFTDDEQTGQSTGE